MKTAFVLILCSAILICGCIQEETPIGGDADEHGCLIAAGYSWCEAKGKCLRPWEENCSVACTAEAKICPDGSAVGRTGPDCEFAPCPHLVGNDSDEHGCIGSAGYYWCEDKGKCVREWEEPCSAVLTKEQAIAFANASRCVSEGAITDEAFYNENSRTWWVEMDIEKPGCSPACVVDEMLADAEINWRCTGLIPE